ncbi:PHP domain-containing protein [Taylorella equigenitalis]|uniref:Predicted metal-dependent phosphoesterases (PHP family) n=3 Tax=Taylorella equigenitalis TaxID=29575 RepID=A0A654KI56_TAYEM|nr:PHP domain-containing protein [Taylorella equigenitalis]ADU92178.1 Predicted metal-dependent phosphoesterases (PHP family) [Taylorella equigenitalis MCE9]AFN35737.1 PHP domain protein [Taylorella equigenitalis ATCC 35865]ASY37687.1 PHP domain-containing protein [Taylorella equigenitalis]ASY39155.1 phosphatase [Taylorella equigenitalis]ASY40673.1 phosphatase [Taylorella equigenitalis]
MLNVDLHCHSTASDGSYSPDELAVIAKSKNVDIWSLTDHDVLSGQERASKKAQELGIKYVSGVEISATWAGKTVHIVGLNFDIHNIEIYQGLESIRRGRVIRAQEMASKFDALGISGTFEGAMRYSDKEENLSRTHFARYLVDAGVCSQLQEVFDRYLTPGKPAYVAGNWATLEDAVSWIVSAGGVPVIAHPGRYKYSTDEFVKFFNQFKDFGGMAIEVVTGSHFPSQYVEYEFIAKKYGFWASCGSDFHGLEKDNMQLGEVPALPKGLDPVWEHFNE